MLSPRVNGKARRMKRKTMILNGMFYNDSLLFVRPVEMWNEGRVEKIKFQCKIRIMMRSPRVKEHERGIEGRMWANKMEQNSNEVDLK
jgi:hypothetical protein